MLRVTATALCIFGMVFGQPVPTQRFEVASIKPAKAKDRTTNFRIRNGRFVGESVTVRLLIAIAYGLQDFQISGGPGWVNSDTFDVDGKADSGDANTVQVRGMLQSLLADRFKLTIHPETKDSSVYALVVGKNGPKIKRSSDQTPGVMLGPHGSVKIENGSIVGSSIPLPLFISLLGRRLDRTIVNRTGLDGRFDIALKWTPDVGEPTKDTVEATQAAAGSAAPSIFTAIQEQLGLKLQSSKGPSGFLVIDHVEKPSEN